MFGSVETVAPGNMSAVSKLDVIGWTKVFFCLFVGFVKKELYCIPLSAHILFYLHMCNTLIKLEINSSALENEIILMFPHSKTQNLAIFTNVKPILITS